VERCPSSTELDNISKFALNSVLPQKPVFAEGVIFSAVGKK
jgi:hypothetical protein